MHNLLGREPIDENVNGDHLEGRTVLVTGAGGSIGAELCRQVHGFDPKRLVMLGHGESTLAAIHAEVCRTPTPSSGFRHAHHGECEMVVADIRDPERILQVFSDVKPDIVLHAAALKHQPILEKAPGEAVKTNILGTANVLLAASLNDVGTFVNVSTDKAADPSCVLGASKRIAERLTAWYGLGQPPGSLSLGPQISIPSRRYVSVRFGNVLASRGSVLTVFARQIAAGGPLTVTHPDVDRYFMTTPEAAGLALHAAGIGEPGEVLVLDMGDPVKISDIADRMSEIVAGGGLPIIYTGLRPGEKLHETLIGRDEIDVRPTHPLISQIPVPPLHPRILEWLPRSGTPDVVAAELKALAGAPAVGARR